MKWLNKIMVSPASIYGWSAAFFFALFFAIPFLDVAHVITQGTFVYLSLCAFTGLVIALMLLTILTSLVFWDWFRRNWYINTGIFACAFLVLVRLFLSNLLH